jgi:hypothetical protein
VKNASASFTFAARRWQQGGVAGDRAFHRFPDEARILDGRTGDFDDERSALRQDPNQPRLAELDKGLAHRLAAHSKAGRDVLLGQHLAGSDAHGHDRVTQHAGHLPGNRLRWSEIDGEGRCHRPRSSIIAALAEAKLPY